MHRLPRKVDLCGDTFSGIVFEKRKCGTAHVNGESFGIHSFMHITYTTPIRQLWSMAPCVSVSSKQITASGTLAFIYGAAILVRLKRELALPDGWNYFSMTVIAL